MLCKRIPVNMRGSQGSACRSLLRHITLGGHSATQPSAVPTRMCRTATAHDIDSQWRGKQPSGRPRHSRLVHEEEILPKTSPVCRAQRLHEARRTGPYAQALPTTQLLTLALQEDVAAATSAPGWPPNLAPCPCQVPPQFLPRACPCAARPPAASATWAAASRPRQRRAAESLRAG